MTEVEKLMGLAVEDLMDLAATLIGYELEKSGANPAHSSYSAAVKRRDESEQALRDAIEKLVGQNEAYATCLNAVGDFSFDQIQKLFADRDRLSAELEACRTSIDAVNEDYKSMRRHADTVRAELELYREAVALIREYMKAPQLDWHDPRLTAKAEAFLAKVDAGGKSGDGG